MGGGYHTTRFCISPHLPEIFHQTTSAQNEPFWRISFGTWSESCPGKQPLRLTYWLRWNVFYFSIIVKTRDCLTVHNVQLVFRLFKLKFNIKFSVFYFNIGSVFKCGLKMNLITYLIRIPNCYETWMQYLVSPAVIVETSFFL